MKLDLPTIPEQITGNWLPESTDAKWRWVFRVMLVLVILGIVAFLIYDIMLFL